MDAETRRAKHRDYMREYLRRPDQIEKNRERSRKWYAANHERALAAQADYRRNHPGQSSAWIRSHPERRRIYNLARYGTTTAEFDRRLADQGGGCFFCGRRDPGGRAGLGHLLADHDHKTGLFRGVLCVGCNLSLGYFERGWKSRLDPEQVADYFEQAKLY